MRQIRTRLTYANVMSSIAVFLILSGATAFAAHRLGRHSVGARQLKANAVTTAKLKRNAVTTRKIKKNAVTAAKIRAGAIFTDKLANGAVTGEKIAPEAITAANVKAGSLPFSQVVARLRTTSTLSFAGKGSYGIGSYTQAAGEDDQYLAGLEIVFDGSCEPPRVAEALLVDSAAGEHRVLGLGVVKDEGEGAVTRRMEFAPGETGTMSRLSPSAATGHDLSATLIGEKCEFGSGITATGGMVDVIGSR